MTLPTAIPCVRVNGGNPQILARENMEQKTEDFLWVDWMRVLATFGVVFLHTASPLLSMYHKVPDSYWWI
ncbi:MAG: hypothetical protein KC643_26400, partial [Nitrospira sp.]|nr:hypothetical protein [Nitrospira sp.]